MQGPTRARGASLNKPAMWRTLFKSDLRVPLVTLAAASALGVALVGVRTALTWRGQHLYLVWNLVLAWVPLMLALHIERHQQFNGRKDWKFWAAVLAQELKQVGAHLRRAQLDEQFVVAVLARIFVLAQVVLG